MKGLWQRTKARLTKKLGPAPVWVYVVVVLVGAIYLYRRHLASSTAATTAAATTGASTQPDTTSGYDMGSGGAGGGPTPDTTPLSTAPVSWDPSQLAAAIAADMPPQTPGSSTPVLPPDVTPPQVPGSSPPRTRTGAAAPLPASAFKGGIPVTGGGKTVLGAELQTPGGKQSLVVPGESPPPGWEYIAETVTKKAASLYDVPPVGASTVFEAPLGATNIKRLPTGAIEYTTRTGAVIEQAPGGSRYRASVGSSGITPKAPAPAAPAHSSSAGSAQRTPAAAAPSRTTQAAYGAPTTQAAAPRAASAPTTRARAAPSTSPTHVTVQKPNAPTVRATPGHAVAE